MEIRVLGPLVVRDAGRPVAIGGRRQRAVLVGLLASGGTAVPVERLIAIVWGETPPPTARKSLQTYIARLRRILGPATIRSVGDGYALDTDAVDVDADRFMALADRAHHLLETDPDAAWERFDEALSLWRGTPFDDLDDTASPGLAVRLEEARLLALEGRIDAAIRLGRHATLIGELQALVEAHPMREGFWYRLMLVLYRSGRQAEALATYQTYRGILGDELGLDPGPAIQQLESSILRHEPSLRSSMVAAPEQDPSRTEPEEVPPRNPFKGLRAFVEEDAGDFFGREALTAELVARLEAGTRCLVLVGPSGSGKSSVASAGLIPALRRASGDRPLLVARMTPGTHPFTQLEAALTRATGATRPVALAPDDDLGLLRAVLSTVPDQHTELVLLVDQFEELLTATIPGETVRAFVRNLAEAIEDPHGQLVAVLTIRADFLDHALQLPELAELVAADAVNVGPLSSAELHAAIVGPAHAVGLQVEPAFVAELVAEVAHRPGSLPLLQFVLTQLTEQADRGVLTLAALRDAGGIHGTLARHAESLYGSLPPDGRAEARRLMLHLVTLGEGGEPVRRVARTSGLALHGETGADRRRALETLVAGRLLVQGRDPTSGDTTVEVAHEAVLREWPRCARWIEEAASELRLAAELERAATEWVAAGRSDDYLLTGARLDLHVASLAGSELTTTPVAEDYIAASRRRRDELELAERRREQRERELERRALRRLQAAVAVLVVLVLATGSLSVLAARRGDEAERQRNVAIAAVSEMLVRQLSSAAIAEAGRDPELSLLLALHAVRVATLRGEPVARETVEALHWGLQESGVQYPVTEAEPLLLAGAEGPRGAFALPTGALVDLAMRTVGRQLRPDECEAFLPTQDCAPLPDDLDERLIPATGTALSAASLAGTKVRLGAPPDPLVQRGLAEAFASFTDETGIEVVLVESSWAQVPEAGEAVPELIDVHLVEQPLSLRAEVEAGRLMDLGAYLGDDAMHAAYDDHLLAAGAGAHGELHGLPVQVGMKSMVWYPRRAFERAGYSVPRTWTELIELSDRIVEDGGSPWCFTEQVDDGSSSGWPATDWVEDVLLREHGPAVYDDWVAGTLPFADPRVRSAFERLGQLVFTDGYVAGGGTGATAAPIGSGWWHMFDDPPGCWLYHFPSFAVSLAPPDVVVGEDLDAFVTPVIDPRYADAIVVQAAWAVASTDRPEVRAVVRYLADPSFGTQGYLDVVAEHVSPNRHVDRGAYPDAWRRAVADAFARAQEAGMVRLDGSDAMPDGTGLQPFWDATLAYLRGGPATLDDVLAGLDAEREQRRARG